MQWENGRQWLRGPKGTIRKAAIVLAVVVVLLDKYRLGVQCIDDGRAIDGWSVVQIMGEAEAVAVEEIRTLGRTS